jgi:uncharacterized membrane protein
MIEMETNEFIVMIFLVVFLIIILTGAIVWIIMKNKCNIQTYKTKNGNKHVIFTDKKDAPVIVVKSHKKKTKT